MQTKKLKFSAREIAVISLFAAVTAILTQIIIPGPVPFSMGIFAVMLCSVVLPMKLSLASVLVFLLAGAVGLPVFTGFSGGFQWLAGPTGGYLIGYLGLIITASLIDKSKSKMLRTSLALIAGTLVCYAFGTAWLAVGLGYSYGAAFGIGALPFILPDTAKAIAAAGIGLRLRKALGVIKIDN